MLDSQDVALQFQSAFGKMIDFSDFDFLVHSQAESAVRLIVSQTSLELMRRLQQHERLDDLHLLLSGMDQSLNGAIAEVPETFLLTLIAINASVFILLFMVESAMNPSAPEDPS